MNQQRLWRPTHAPSLEVDGSIRAICPPPLCSLNVGDVAKRGGVVSCKACLSMLRRSPQLANLLHTRHGIGT